MKGIYCEMDCCQMSGDECPGCRELENRIASIQNQLQIEMNLRFAAERSEVTYRNGILNTNRKLVERLDELIEAREKIVELQEQLLEAKKVTP